MSETPSMVDRANLDRLAHTLVMSAPTEASRPTKSS